MSKVYIYTHPGTKLVCATIDLERLPAGVTNTFVTDWGDQIEDILRFLQADIQRAARITQNIGDHALDGEAKQFLSWVASLIENAMPSEVAATDWVFGIFQNKVSSTRMRPDVAATMFEKMREQSPPSL
jgi:hypothetical protein